MTRHELIEAARAAWRTMDETGTEDYDELWGAVVDAVAGASVRDDVLERVVRIETRLAKLMLHFGLNPATGQPDPSTLRRGRR